MEINYSFNSENHYDPIKPVKVIDRYRLEQLPEKIREVIILRHYADMSFKEIAATTDSDIINVKQRAAEGVELLRKMCQAALEAIKENAKQKDIIPDIQLFSDLNKSLLKAIAKNNHELHNINARQFEELIAEILDKQGMEVFLTKQTRDGGTDIIVKKK